MKRITLENLNKRPSKYVDRVLAVATIEQGDIICISDEDFDRIHNPLPSLPQRAINFADQTRQEAVAIARGVPPVTEEEAARRLDICKSNVCGFWRETDGACSQCGCPMAKKTPWRSAVCPVGKW